MTGGTFNVVCDPSINTKEEEEEDNENNSEHAVLTLMTSAPVCTHIVYPNMLQPVCFLQFQKNYMLAFLSLRCA